MRDIYIMLVLSAISLPVFSQVPDISLKDTDGKSVNLKTTCLEGKPTVISFFATWCKPCLRELNAIADVYDEWQEQTGVRLIAVSLDRAQDEDKVRGLADGNNWDYTVLLDTDNSLKQLMHVQTVPHLFVVDCTGKIVEQHSGYTDGEEQQLFEILRKITCQK